MKILTIVVPSYNTSGYIDECLPTLIDKMYIDDIEILLIDDGSKDNTAEKAKRYVEKYPDSIRLICKENGGHGSVINRGIKEAAGKYFKVIDGDDWVITENLGKLVEKLKKIEVDLVCNPYIRHHVLRHTNERIEFKHNQSNVVMTFEEACTELDFLALHGITYRTDLLRNNEITLTENCFFEDAEYDIFPVLYINTVIFLQDPVYVYRIGTSTQSVNPQNAIRNRNMLYKILTNLIEFYHDLPSDISNVRLNFIRKFICDLIYNNYGLYLKMKFGKESKEALAEFDRKLLELSPELYQAASSLAIKLLRKNSWIFYTAGYIVFRGKIRMRGF